MVVKKPMLIAGANIRKHKSAVVSLFLILTVVSMLCTIGLSIIIGVMKDYEYGIERLNGLHSAFIMTKEMYKPEYEDILKNDSRVSEYDINEAVFIDKFKINYGGETEHRVMFLNADAGLRISAPLLHSQDETTPREHAVYLPDHAQRSFGYKTGDPFVAIYRNKPLELRVAGFFEASEYGMPNGLALKLFVANECFQELTWEIGSSVWIAARFHDPYDSFAFNEDFRAQMDTEISAFQNDAFVADFVGTSENSITPIMILTALILVFALIIVLISFIVTRFRVTSAIADAMHTIGVLKASGYTSRQIIATYLMEYGTVSLPAALLGVLLSVPLFSPVRQALSMISGTKWTLSSNIPAGIIAALLLVALTLIIALRACRRIRKIPPVDALRGGTSSSSFRRNRFPLDKGAGGANTRLGLKNTMAYGKQYAAIGIILAVATFAIVIIVAMYQNFVMDNAALIRMVGIETSDVVLTVARHTDADALANDLELMPEVRNTLMLDMIGFQIDGSDAMGFCSNDYSRMETMLTYEGRFPIYDNEVAFPKLLAERLGKTIG
ncbi:MAG: ABC transporter permease, partial [Oscillospiraceae bacterium]|nr:ABC transporter permease [Oscillospiraceae bacterium]